MTEDRITVSRMKVPAHIGVTEDERAVPQPLLIDLDLVVDLSAAGKSDELHDTVDYGRLVTEVAGLVRASRSQLLENLAESIARFACSLPRVERVTVAVAKESPPVTEDVEAIIVRIARP